MNIYGIDFTSSPKRSKPITCMAAILEGDLLRTCGLKAFTGFEEFERALGRPGPWVMGIDFPFGQSRRFVETIGWPKDWRNCVQYARALGRQGFRDALDAYRKDRPPGDKEHRRTTDVAAGSISPQKLYGTPVGLMFFEGAPRLINAGVMVPALQQGDPERIVIEAYPGVLARGLVGRRSYKQDSKAKQTVEQREVRRDIMRKIKGGALVPNYGLRIQISDDLVADPTGDRLDALLCAIQAAWAWTQRHNNYGTPQPVDSLEGWIADPNL